MFEEVLNFITRSNKSWLVYAPYRFLPENKTEKSQNENLLLKVRQLSKNNSTFVFKAEVSKFNHYFIVSPLSWDTEYFGFPIFRIEYIFYDHQSLETLNTAINQFYTFTCKFSKSYFYIDIPAEDILLIQSLGAPFRLIETRLNYILKNFSKIANNYPVRVAKEEDIYRLKEIAMKSVNPFDRVHADVAFSKTQADEYLGTFIENAVKGYADVVLVPDLPQTPPFAFLAFNRPVEINSYKVSKLVLAASDSTVERGWLYKLLVEAIKNLQSEGITHLTTITQANNLPAIKSWEKAGFDYGFCTHIFSFTTA